MTPEDILRISEYLEALYIDTHDALILTLAKHLKSKKQMTLKAWEEEKYSEMRALMYECALIVSKGEPAREKAIFEMLDATMQIELSPIDEMLTKAVDAGKATEPIDITWKGSSRVSEVIQTKAREIARKTQLVNATMLQSAQQECMGAVRRVVNSVMVRAGAEAGVESIMTGEKSFADAVAEVIQKLAHRGVYGFKDIKGREWSPEAYINLVTRTAIHGAAIEAQRERTAEYGITTFQIGPNKISRPLCAPYVGWICSWDGSSGIIHDLDGNAYQYVPITDTSYGEPAGIFGINCGHSPYTFVDGFSLPRYHEMTPEEMEKNDTEYLLTQQQRALERELRSAKVTAAALRAAGYGSPETESLAASMTKQYKEWCAENDLTPRMQRLDVFVSPNATMRYRKEKKAKWAVDAAEEAATAKTIQMPDGRTVRLVKRVLYKDTPNAIAQITRAKGGIERIFYNENGIQYKQVHMHNHGNPKAHPFGKKGEHIHSFEVHATWSKRLEAREMTDEEKNENADILPY